MSKLSIQSFLLYFSIFLLVINSGSVVGIVFGSVTLPLFLGLTIFFVLIFKKNISIKNIVFLFVFILYALMNYFHHLDDNPYSKSYAIIIVGVCATMLLVSSISYLKFKLIFTNIILFVSVFSLIMYFIGLNFDLLQYSTNIGGYQTVLGFNLYALSVGRNSGLFWEPGGFQIFLSLALYFIIDMNQEKLKVIDWIKVGIIVVSILTTKSTVGYIILVILALYYAYKKVSSKTFVYGLFFSVIALPIVTIILSVIYYSDPIQVKFTQTNMSFLERQNDFFSSIQAIRESPYLGFGYGTDTRIFISNKYGLVNNSVGYFSTALNLGVVYVIGYMLRIIHVYRKSHSTSILLFLLLMLLLNSTQAIFDYPILLLFLFKFNESEEIVNSEILHKRS